MRDRWVVVAVVATLLAVAGAAAHADSRPQKFELEANVPGVSATASILGSSLSVSVEGAAAGAYLDAAVARLACARSFVVRGAGGKRADAGGGAHWSTEGLVTDAFRDGRHVVAVWNGARMVACAAIPSGTPQARGLWSFTRRFVN